jgi:parvulin-like peptidyl-prolyl isomerase
VPPTELAEQRILTRASAPAERRALTPVYRARILLAAGAALGFAAALTAILEKRELRAIPSDAVAVVNGSPIRAVDFERAVGALASDRREPPSEADRTMVLDRLIEEELLVQRAKDLGMVEHDRGVRTRLVSGMMETILADAAGAEPTAEELSAFYRENAGFFAPIERAWLREIRIAVSQARPEAEARRVAERAGARLRRGENFATVARELGDPPIAPLPDGLLPATKLREYLGPAVTESALALPPGGVTDPIRGGSALHVLQMVEREPGAPPELGTIEPEVRAEMRRRRDDLAMRAYLGRLREQATIWMRQP